MNAYELADQVEMWGEDLLALNMKGGIPVVEGAKLIRQQADKIAELEKQNEALEQLRPYWAKGFSNDSVAAQCTVSAMSELHKLLGVNNQTDAVIKIKQQQKRLAELEKQNEPVAWMSPDGKVSQTEGLLFHIPLFTTPQTKPLSDEEIISIADSLSLIHYYDSDGEWSGITNEPMFRVEENRNNERLLEILKPFARAIEERHGIK